MGHHNTKQRKYLRIWQKLVGFQTRLQLDDETCRMLQYVIYLIILELDEILEFIWFASKKRSPADLCMVEYGWLVKLSGWLVGLLCQYSENSM